MKTLVAFDLDDTLYPEISFVYSGFSGVADELSKFGKWSHDEIFSRLRTILDEQGRGKVFNQLLTELGLRYPGGAAKLVTIYRRSPPQISLYENARETLKLAEEISGNPPPVVTDGNRFVQRSKVKALGLAPLISKVYFTRDYGVRNEKPSPFVFDLVAKSFGVETSNLVYVGDDPSKDFESVVKRGGTGIRVRQGRLRDMENFGPYSPQFTVENLTELQYVLNENFN